MFSNFFFNFFSCFPCLGGCIDLRSWDIPSSIGITRVVTELRKAGLICWYRTTAQGFDPHIHCVEYGNPDLHYTAGKSPQNQHGIKNAVSVCYRTIRLLTVLFC